MNEDDWERFRMRNFFSSRLNLNPGTLGSTSAPMAKAVRDYDRAGLPAFPLGQYEAGRASLRAIHHRSRRLWPFPGMEISASGGTTAVSSILTLALPEAIRKFRRSSKKIRVLSTPHEHYGGIGGFEAHQSYEVFYLTEKEVRDSALFDRRVAKLHPDLAFFSHVTYDLCLIYPVAKWSASIRRLVPNCLIVLDVAQSLGLLPLPQTSADALTGSAHKWVFGPPGSGFLWMTRAFRDKLGAFFWSGMPLVPNRPAGRFEFTGSMDFALFPRLNAALALYQSAGPANVLARSRELGRAFATGLTEVLSRAGVQWEFFSGTGFASFSVNFRRFDPFPLYQYLNGRNIHVKCIKSSVQGKMFQILRFGFPYFETHRRLKKALNAVAHFFYNHDRSKP